MMKTKRTLTIATVLVALAVLVTLGILRGTRPVKAQSEVPPPGADRISFGMVGITQGQTMRVTVSDILTPNDTGWPPGPTRVVLNFRKANGQLVRNRSGEVIRRAVDLERGDSTFLDVDFADVPPPTGDRLQLRAVIVAQSPPQPDSNVEPPPNHDRLAITVEVINNANDRTAFVMSKDPGYRRLNSPSGQ